MGRQGSRIVDHVGHVLRAEGVIAFIDFLCRFLFALEAHHGELGFGGAGVNGRHLDMVGKQVHAHALANGFDGGLAGAVDASAQVDFLGGRGADVDDLTFFPFHHEGDDGFRHVEQAFDVGIDHGGPVGEFGILEEVLAEGEAGIINKDIDGLPFSGKGVDGSEYGLLVLHIEGEQEAGGVELVFECFL